MQDRRAFLRSLAAQNPTRLEQAIALLWFYEYYQEYDERTTSALAEDIKAEGFGGQSVSRLKERLTRSRITVKGSTAASFRINSGKYQDLSDKYEPLLGVIQLPPSSSVVPQSDIQNCRPYIKKIAAQVNASFDNGAYDAAAVLLRRLEEMLLVEIYDHQGRLAAIKDGNNVTYGLEKLINTATADQAVSLGRGKKDVLTYVKDIGDAAAHDRYYITKRADIADKSSAIRRLISELIVKAGQT